MIEPADGRIRQRILNEAKPRYLHIRVNMNGVPNLTKDKLLKFLDRLGASAKAAGTCFITGGASALLLGWRETTIDVDLKFDLEPAGVFDAIRP
jgi:hypothetical protein